MLNWLRNKKKEPERFPEKEFSFIWFGKVETGNKRIFTQPFRTKVMAKNLTMGQTMVADFAADKLKIVVVPEELFGNSDLGKFERQFKQANEKMNELFEKINDGFL